MISPGKIKRKIILRIIIILLPVILIFIGVGIVVLLAKLDIIPTTTTSSTNSGNVGINMSPDVRTLLAMSDTDVWKGLTGGLLSERPNDKSPSNAGQIEAAVRSQIVSITVPVRKWENPGDSTNMNRKETQETLEVNSLLSNLWTQFFTDVYNSDPNFVMNSVGCFRIDGTGYGQIGFKSAHTYGAAVDINWYDDGNPYGSVSDVHTYTKAEWEALPENHLKYQIIYIDSPIVQIAHQYTLLWGGDWTGNTRDLMHFSFVADGKTREQRLQLAK